MSIEDVRRVVEQPLQEMLPSFLEAQVPLMAKLNTTIFCAEGAARFITSDAPCVWYDPESYKRPRFWRGPALMYKSLEITLPLSPDRLLFLSYGDLPDYWDVSDEVVHELNRRTRAYAYQEFIARSSQAEPFWYEPGEPPPGGWDEDEGEPEDEDEPQARWLSS